MESCRQREKHEQKPCGRNKFCFFENLKKISFEMESLGIKEESGREERKVVRQATGFQKGHQFNGGGRPQTG